MSNIRIDNPQRLLALAEQMNGFQNAFGKFIENMRNAVKTTMDQLTRLKITMQNKINEVDNEISALYNERSSYSWPVDKEAIWDIDDQIKSAKAQRSIYIEQKKKIDKAYKDIDYQYKHNVKAKEESLSKAIFHYPKGIEALNLMESLMKKYLTFSSELVKTNNDGNYGGFKPKTESEQLENFENYREFINKNNSSYTDKIAYGRLKNGNLTDQILANAELEAQQKNTKFVEFEIGDNDTELCKRAGYELFNKNGKQYAIKDLHSEIDLKGGLFKGGAIYTSSQEYELD